MAQGRSPEIISIIKWIRTSRLSIKNSLSLVQWIVFVMKWIPISWSSTKHSPSLQESLSEYTIKHSLSFQELPLSGQVFILTDGQVGNEDEVFELVAPAPSLCLSRVDRLFSS